MAMPVLSAPVRLVLLDNYDSFTYNLYDYLLQLGASCVVLRNDTASLAEIESIRPEGIVLSPGPCRPEDAGILMPVIAHFFARVPILGVCLGHQGLGTFFGARLVHAAKPMHGKTSPIRRVDDVLFEGLPETFAVMRYHSLVLEGLEGTPLLPLAYSEDSGELMAMRHRELPLWGVQFHPESILTPLGISILSNWLAAIKRP